jgi:asparagine synthase (glutamine-hydrolysing)
MCGIVGQFGFFDKEIGLHEEQILSRLVALIARRGPDDQGLWSDERRCLLGFRRLAVLDLSPTGHQPMLTQDGRYAIVYNGEVYNFQELRQRLEQKGVRFRSTGDGEVVLYSLAYWGTEALARFNGMFALGFYDKAEKSLLLARDHAGIKPLYYMLTPHGLVFASQYDQILAHPWSRGMNVSAEALALYLRLGYIPAPYALLENTYMLEPGSWLEITNEGHVQPGRFFDFPVFREPDLHGEEANEAVDASITAAVRRQLVSDVPLGTFLSGGIDSPLVAAKMKMVKNQSVLAFTMGTNGDHMDESPDAVRYAGELGIEHIIEHVTTDHALAMLDDIVNACSEPFADYSIFPTMVVSRMAGRQVKVMLSGDGGDELFWGYAGRFASVLEGVAGSRKSHTRRKPSGALKKILALGTQHLDPRWPSSIGDCYRIKHTHLSEGWLNRILPDLPEWPSDFSLFKYNGLEPDLTAQWLRWNEFVSHLTMVLLKVDRASMYHSLEVRVPLLDREVIEVAERVDWRSCLLLGSRIGKLPLRKALKRHVHYQTWTKRGFIVPMGDWLRGPLRSVFEETVVNQKEILGLPTNRQAIREMFHRHQSKQADYDRGLWVLLSLALWEEKHFRTRQ